MPTTSPDLGPIEIRPEVTLLSMLRHLNYKPGFTIAESINNAVNANAVGSVASNLIYEFKRLRFSRVYPASRQAAHA